MRKPLTKTQWKRRRERMLALIPKLKQFRRKLEDADDAQFWFLMLLLRTWTSTSLKDVEKREVLHDQGQLFLELVDIPQSWLESKLIDGDMSDEWYQVWVPKIQSIWSRTVTIAPEAT